MDNKSEYSLVQADVKKIGTNVNLPRNDPTFSNDDAFWSSGITNGIPTSKYSQYDPSMPRTNSTAASVSDLERLQHILKTMTREATITQSGKTEEEWKTHYLAIGITLLIIGLIVIVASIYFIFLRANSNHTSPTYVLIAIWFFFWSILACVGIYLAADHKSLAVKAYEKQKENNEATVDGRVIDSTTIIRE